MVAVGPLEFGVGVVVVIGDVHKAQVVQTREAEAIMRRFRDRCERNSLVGEYRACC